MLLHLRMGVKYEENTMAHTLIVYTGTHVNCDITVPSGY